MFLILCCNRVFGFCCCSRVFGFCCCIRVFGFCFVVVFLAFICIRFFFVIFVFAAIFGFDSSKFYTWNFIVQYHLYAGDVCLEVRSNQNNYS